MDVGDILDFVDCEIFSILKEIHESLPTARDLKNRRDTVVKKFIPIPNLTNSSNKVLEYLKASKLVSNLSFSLKNLHKMEIFLNENNKN